MAVGLIGDPSVFADIGCDHAYAACTVALRNKAARVIACDISRGSLDKAAATVARFSMETRIELRVGDGFQPLQYGEADTVLIAGMGAYRIMRILESGRKKATALNRIVLCPHNNVPALRAYLMRNGYCIEREALAFENNVYYELLQVRYSGKFLVPDILECEVGSRLFDDPDNLLACYLKFRIEKIDNIINSASGSLPAEVLGFKSELRRFLEKHLSCL